MYALRLHQACLAIVFVIASLAACNWMDKNYYRLEEQGFALYATPGKNDFLFVANFKKVAELGGNANTPQFEQFVSQTLKAEGYCKNGWARVSCRNVASCDEPPKNGVSVYGYCTPEK